MMTTTTIRDGVTCLADAGKHELMMAMARAYDLHVFVETGTHEGDTVAAMLASGQFERVCSVELGEPHFERAARRLAGDPRLDLAHGDSGEFLEQLVPRLGQPTLFWLDAHPGEPGTAGVYGRTPLRQELHAIFDGGGGEIEARSSGDREDPPWRPREAFPDGTALPHVVLIDDARLFHHAGWVQLPEIREIARGWDVTLADDIVRITRPR